MGIGKGILVVFYVAVVSDSVAQIDPDPDGVGIYFDQEATQVTAIAEIGDTVTGYLIATNPSQDGGLALWEAVVHSPMPDAIIWGGAANGTNLATNMPPGGPTFSFVVTPDAPLPPLNSITILGTLVITVLIEGPIELEVLGYSYEFPMYRVDDPYGQDRSLYPSSGSVDLPVAVINGPAPVANEQYTWGDVKSLYR